MYIAAAGAVDQKLLDIGRARARARGRARARDFESRAGSGAAGDRKVNGFQLKTFRKASILSAGQGRERPGIEKSSVLN